MLEALLLAIEGLPPVEQLRLSTWVYPLVNATHILGVALLVGGILPLDLRLAGLWRAVPVAPLWTILTRGAATGLALAIASGLLLFATRASEYALSQLFLAKMLVVATGAANALALHLSAGVELRDMLFTDRVPRRVRAVAVLSLSLWLAALLLGRLVAYF